MSNDLFIAALTDVLSNRASPGKALLVELVNNLEKLKAPQTKKLNPAANIHRTEERYTFIVALMGVKPEDISVDIRDNGDDDEMSDGKHVHVEAVVKEPFPEQENMYAYKEFDMNCQLRRCLDIPSDSDIENTTSTLADGILTVVIPRLRKSDNATTPSIKIIPVATRS